MWYYTAAFGDYYILQPETGIGQGSATVPKLVANVCTVYSVATSATIQNLHPCLDAHLNEQHKHIYQLKQTKKRRKAIQTLKKIKSNDCLFRQCTWKVGVL